MSQGRATIWLLVDEIRSALVRAAMTIAGVVFVFRLAGIVG